MRTWFGRTVILVKDYDEAAAFYMNALDMVKLHDSEADGQRYVHLGFKEQHGPGLWLIKATKPVQEKLVGYQTGGHPALVIYTDSFKKVHKNLVDKKVKIVQEPVESPEAVFLHFIDLYGNDIVLVELK